MRKPRSQTRLVLAVFSVVGLAGLIVASPFICCGVVGYRAMFNEGPSYGYPNRVAYKEAELDARASKLEPILAALQKYQGDRGRYPKELKELVSEKYLKELPTFPDGIDHQGEPSRIMGGSKCYTYSTSSDRSAFGLGIQLAFRDENHLTAHGHAERCFLSRTGLWQPGYLANSAPELKADWSNPPEKGPMPREID